MTLSKVTSIRNLKALQKAFLAIITRPLGPKWSMARDSRTAAMIVPSPTLSPHERMQLYAQQYWWRVLDSLREDFPGLQTLLGEKRFSALLVRYLNKHPSQSYTLRNLGQFMPQFLARDRGLPRRTREQSKALAAVEWARIQAFDGQSLATVCVEDLSGNAESLRLTIQPYLQLLTVPYAVDKFLQESSKAALPHNASNVRRRKAVAVRAPRRKLSLRKANTLIGVYRIGARTLLTRLTPVEYRLVIALQQGGTLHQILRRLLKARQAPSTKQIQLAFQKLAALKLIAKSPQKARQRDKR